MPRPPKLKNHFSPYSTPPSKPRENYAEASKSHSPSPSHMGLDTSNVFAPLADVHVTSGERISLNPPNATGFGSIDEDISSSAEAKIDEAFFQALGSYTIILTSHLMMR